MALFKSYFSVTTEAERLSNTCLINCRLLLLFFFKLTFVVKFILLTQTAALLYSVLGKKCYTEKNQFHQN